ncbi:MAG: acetyl-CoA carboxylase biotin carboxyl carrier protein [Pseudolabrys sp.]
MNLSYEDVAEILKVIDSSSCDELVVETSDLKLVVRRNGAGGTPGPVREVSTPAPASAAAAPASPRPAPAPATPTAKLEADVNQTVVAAPMVGTFYRASSPDAPPFVEIGSTVRKGDPVCLIEVMKLFTTINADCDGRIVQIGAENGELVEFGQTLFVVEPVA